MTRSGTLLNILLVSASGMNSGGLYRHGMPSSVTRQQGASATGFYRPNIDGQLLDGGAGHVVPPPAELEKKIDQMMNMLSGTQQFMLAQQATTQRLEESLAKINTEVANIQTDVKKLSEEVGQTAQSTGKGKSSRKVPTELKV